MNLETRAAGWNKYSLANAKRRRRYGYVTIYYRLSVIVTNTLALLCDLFFFSTERG